MEDKGDPRETVGQEQGDGVVMKAWEEGDPKGPQPAQLSVTEKATKIKVAESIEEYKRFLLVEESILSKWWVEGKL